MSPFEGAFFSGSRSNYHVYGGNYTHASGDYNQYVVHGDLIHGDREPGLQDLSQRIATGALHDSQERFPPPKCHPQTRKKILRFIMNWIESAEAQDNLLWLYGPAGAGKSAILQTIAELCKGYLAASFFFSKGKPGRDDERNLFATIAYQLALAVPGLRAHVNRAMVSDPALHTKDIQAQLRALIIDPLQRLANPPSQVFLVIIDGLDECQEQPQRQILECIMELLSRSSIRLRFLLTSRPEDYIRSAFDQPHIDHRTKRVALDRSWNPDRDVRIYLQDGFDEIVKRNPDVFSTFEGPWPTKEVFDRLVEKSSGQFIYPATVLRFVGAERYHPIKQLDIVLSPAGSPPSSPTLHSSIDNLYTQILYTCPYPDVLARILSMLLILHCPQPPEVFADILGVPKGDVTVTLRGLHSLIRTPNEEEDHYERHKFSNRFEYDQTRGLRLHHATFRDYLLDPSRCPSSFVVDLAAAHFKLAKAGSELVLHWVSAPWSLETKLRPPCHETWGYLKHHMGIHLDQCRLNDRKRVLEALDDFHVVFPPRRRIDDKIWIDSFHGLHSLVTALAEVVLSEIGHSEPQLLNPANFQSEHSHWTKETTDVTIPSTRTVDTSQTDVLRLHRKFCKLLDAFYLSILSSSKGALELLDNLPGFTDQQTPVLFDWLKDICVQDARSLSLMVEQNQMFIYRWDTNYWTQVLTAGQGHISADVVWVNPHFATFLRNPERAGKYYWDPKVRHLLDLCQIIEMIFSSAWLRVPKQPGALEYLDRILKTCFDSITVDSLEAPVQHREDKLKLLDVLADVKYHIPSLTDAPVHNVDLIWSVTRRLLDWIYRQISSKKLERKTKRKLVDISNHVYRQILEIDTSRHGRREVTIQKPFLAALSRNTVPVGVHSSPPSATHADSLNVSETLLALHGLRASLTSFLTKEERAGDFFLSPKSYHTQMAEACLDRCEPSIADITQDWKTVPSHTEWRFHLTRALPSSRILERLASIPLGPWLAEGLPSSERAAKAKSIDAIIQWLEGLPVNQTDSLRRRWEQDRARFQQLKQRKLVSFASETGTTLTLTYSELSSAPPSHFYGPHL